MKKFLLSVAVFLSAGTGTYFLIQKGDIFGDRAFYDSLINSRAAVSETIARTVINTAPKTNAPASSNSTSTARMIIEHGVKVYFVDYENSGFAPKDLKIEAGSSAHFVNNSNKAMRVYSKSQKTPYHFLNESASIKKGEIYKFNFTTKGFWEYYNLNNPKDAGTITVY